MIVVIALQRLFEIRTSGEADFRPLDNTQLTLLTSNSSSNNSNHNNITIADFRLLDNSPPHTYTYIYIYIYTSLSLSIYMIGIGSERDLI